MNRAIRDALLAMGWTPPGPDIAATSPDSTGDTFPPAGGGEGDLGLGMNTMEYPK
jgi:hypothetical protein